jgi:hypothetical protein
MDSDCGCFEGATARKAVLPIVPSCLLDEGRAMPMLFWLPLIFASVLLEMNGFPPQKPENGQFA